MDIDLKFDCYRGKELTMECSGGVFLFVGPLIPNNQT